jgi:hypothetical protein
LNMTNLRHSLLLPGLLLAGACAAQRANPNPAPMVPGFAADENPNGGIVPPGTSFSEDRGGGDVLFYEDFANGLAGNNGVGAWTTAGPNGNIWKRATTGPVGQFSQATQRIGAPATFANGFMAFYSDSANCDWSNPSSPILANPPALWDGALVSPVLNLSATPAVKIEFTQRLRWCCQPTSPHVLEVSTNGGTTWTTSIPTATGIATNDDPGTLVRSYVLTTAIAANPANVRFRFQHNAVAGTYHWQIDDVRIIELYANDLKMDDGYLSHTNNALEYGNIPRTQLYPTMLIGGNVTNRGAVAQTNVTVTTTVRNSANAVVFTANATTPSIAPNATADVSSTVTLPNLPADLYTATFVVSADLPEQQPTDNTFMRGFRITGGPDPSPRYSIDGIGNHPAGMQVVSSLGTQSFVAATDGIAFLTYYQVNQALTVRGIEVGLSTQTVAGGYVTMALRDTTPVFAGTPDLNQTIIESEIIDIDATHVSSGLVTYIFDNPVVLRANNAYFASVSLYSNAGTSHIRVLNDVTVPQPWFATLTYIPAAGGGAGTVFSNGNAMAIRLLTDREVGIDDRKALEGVSIFPNPTNGLVNVRTEFTGTYTIEVMDLTGRTVANALGNGSTTVDLSGQAQGVYMVRVATEQASTVQRIVLN